MEQRVTTYSQYSISSNVNGIKNMEAADAERHLGSEDLLPAGRKSRPCHFADRLGDQRDPCADAARHPAADHRAVQRFQRSGAADQPDLRQLNEQQLYDYGIYRLRQQLAPVPASRFPTPAGGKYRQIMVDLDPTKLLAKGLTPLDVVNAVNAQNLTLPAGTAKIGDTQYTVRTNATPATIADLNDIPVKFANGATVFMKDIGQVRDGSAVQQNIVREDGRRVGAAERDQERQRLDAGSREGVKEALRSGARGRAARPQRSTSCSTSRCSSPLRWQGVVREGAIAAALTALMILLFLGSWRSTLIVMISIPLAILASLVCCISSATR